METLVQVLERDPTPPGRLRPGRPRDLETICLKCLEKDPADRYPSAEALADDLERSLRGEDVEAMRGGALAPAPALDAPGAATGHPPDRPGGDRGAHASSTTPPAPRRDFRLHSGVTGALAAWALASVALQAIARRDRRRDSVRPAWAAADVAFLTLILWLFAAAGTAVGGSMVVGYPLLVAASGLWFRVGLVWLATALAEAGYGLLVLDARLRGSALAARPPPQHRHGRHRGRRGSWSPARSSACWPSAPTTSTGSRVDSPSPDGTGISPAPYGSCRRIRGASGAAVFLPIPWLARPRRLEKGSEAPAVFHVEDEVGPEEGPPPALARWAIPTFAVLFAMNLLDYMDRNILYAVLPAGEDGARG